jgi:hypothetical protein
MHGQLEISFQLSLRACRRTTSRLYIFFVYSSTVLNEGCCCFVFFIRPEWRSRSRMWDNTHVWGLDWFCWLQPILARTRTHTHTKSHMTCIDIDDSFWISCTSMTGLLPEVLPKSLHYAWAEHGVRPRRRTLSPLKPWNETNLHAMDQNGWNLPGDAQFVEHFARRFGIL